MAEMDIPEATRIMFERYLGIINQARHEVDPESPGDSRKSLGNLAWMCAEGMDKHDALPIDKLSRWLGFVQGCLAMRGLISVDAERDFSRPLFHAAYCTAGDEPPGTLERG
ncbi:hypothetical protein ACEUZ9_001058 [Paracoccus litorisediminis]|uniref:hypothetical protein n=1 Tax=Paracoccus litorisediminis TaxID=2006130 RepID=UPI0037324E88